jgi:RNA polymerase sigma-70 factor (ECF subfamily)
MAGHAAEGSYDREEPWQNIGPFEGEARFTTWMTRILMIRCLMRMRHDGRVRLVYVDEPLDGEVRLLLELRDAAEGPEHDVGHKEVDDLVRRDISRIPPMLRNALLLRGVDQLPMPAVAGELGISLAAAKSRLLRAARIEVAAGEALRAARTGHLDGVKIW